MFALLVFLNPAGFFRPFRSGIKMLVSPFQKIAYLISLKAGLAEEFIFSIGQLKKENESLVRESLELKAENARLADIKRQNEILSEQLDLLPRQKFELENAYVISQDPRGFGNWMEISKGSQNGIQEGMPVIVSRGILVGKIEEVHLNSSKVLLATSPESVVGAMAAKSGTKGVVRGEYGLGIILDMVLQTDEIKTGDEIVTSGIGNNVPRGLLIGTAREVRLSPDQLYQQAVITSPVHFSKLEIVSVIKNTK